MYTHTHTISVARKIWLTGKPQTSSCIHFCFVSNLFVSGFLWIFRKYGNIQTICVGSGKGQQEEK